MKGAALTLAIAAALAASPGQRRPAVVQFPAGLARADAIVERDLTSAGPVPVLAREDFTLLVDGQPRPVDYFSSAPAPLSLALLIDVTDSLTLSSSPKEFQQALNDFIMVGLALADRARIGAVGDKLYWTSTLTADKAALARAAASVAAQGSLHGQGPSPVWDAVDEAVQMLAAESVWRRRAVIIVTDGLATGDVHGSEEVARDAALAGVSVTTITERALSSIAAYGPGSDQTIATRVIAETSGGEPFVDGFPPAPRDPARFVRLAIDSLRHAYTLGFTPAGLDGKAHTLEVAVKRPGLVVLARRLFPGG